MRLNDPDIGSITSNPISIITAYVFALVAWLPIIALAAKFAAWVWGWDIG